MTETDSTLDRNAALCRLTEIALLLEHITEDLDDLYDQFADSP